VWAGCDGRPVMDGFDASGPLLVSVSSLSAAEVDGMYALMVRHFSGVSRAQFDEDLGQKNRVVLLRNPSGALDGFSTLRFYDEHDGRRPCSVIYSGDTVVDPGAWGSTRLFRGWLQAVFQLRAEREPGRRLYWLLLTSGYRTYRLLPLFWKRFFPRYDRAVPPRIRGLTDRLADGLFGSAYRPEEGIVRFPRPHRLRTHLAGIPEGRMDDPHIRYFARRNPGAGDGDELVSLTPVREGNLTPAGRRVLRSLEKRAPTTASRTSL